MNGNLSQEVEAGLYFESIKSGCFQQSVLSVLNCHVTAVVTWLLFYLAGSGASSPLTSPSSPTPPSTAGTFKNHCSVYLFMLLFYSQGWLKDDGFQGWNSEMTAWVWACALLRVIENLFVTITFLEVYMLWFTQGVRACFKVCITPGLPTLLLSRHFLGLLLQYAFVLVLMVCWLWNTACPSLVSLFFLFLHCCDVFSGILGVTNSVAWVS